MKAIKLIKVYVSLILAYASCIECSHEYDSQNMKSNKTDSKNTIDKNLRYYDKTCKRILSNLIKNEYKEIEAYFNDYTPEQVQDFYLEKGISILNCAINFSKSSEALKFIVYKSPLLLKTTIDILENNNYDIIRTFLGGINQSDKFGYFKEENRKRFIEKLEILFSLPQHYGIANKIGEIINTEEITDNLKKAFEQAKYKYQKETAK